MSQTETTKIERVVDMMKERGPVTIHDVGDLKTSLSGTSRRVRNIDTFDLMAHSHGTSSTFGNTNAVYYSRDLHPPEEVLRTWLSVNRDVLEHKDVSKFSITTSLSGELRDVWDEIKDEYDWIRSRFDTHHGGNKKTRHETCPLCGDEIECDSLSYHLPECPEGV